MGGYYGSGGGGFSANKYALLEEQLSNGTSAGTATLGSWETRVLNTEVTDTGGFVSLSSNVFTLQPGTYLIKASAPGYAVTSHVIKIYQTTGTPADIKLGTAEYAYTDSDQTRSFVSAVVTISTATGYSILQKVQSTKATNGHGESSNFGVETYTQVEIWKS